MQARCEYSELTVPSEPSYVAVAVAYVDEVSKKLGFEEDQRKKIGLAVEQAVANVMEQTLEPGNRQTFEISCERVPVGLQIIIKERGMPFDPSRIPLFQPQTEGRQESRELPGIPLLRDLVDELSLIHI